MKLNTSEFEFKNNLCYTCVYVNIPIVPLIYIIRLFIYSK